MKLRLGIGTVFTLVCLVACSSTDQQDVDAAAEHLTASDGPLSVPVGTDEADCRSRVLLESGLSDKAKAAVLRGEAPVLRSKRDVAALRKAADQIARDCG